MKQKALWGLGLLVLVLTQSCSFSGGSDYSNEDLLTDDAQYWVEIGGPSEEEYVVENLSKEVRQRFLDDILGKVKGGDLPAFYYLDDTLIPMEKENLQTIFHQVDTEYIENGLDFDTVVYENDLDPDAILRLKFKEQWYWNSSTNQFSKKVLAVCPMAQRFKNEKEILGYVGLFWVKLEEE